MGQQATPSSATTTPDKKSGLVVLNQGDVLFKEGDEAFSLYIIQKGQIRLYRPKGKGFIEIGVVRSGEVIGEMAYFAVEENEKRRSCSAQALIRTEIIEISFRAFDKTMGNLNPWFKTIVNTLASRLRKTNAKVKELESNSVSSGLGGASVGYKFFRSNDIVKLFSMFYLISKSHGEYKEDGYVITKKSIDLYCNEIFNLHESKIEEFANVLQRAQLMVISGDSYRFPNIDIIKTLTLFFNLQRVTPDEKQINISEKCEVWLNKILRQIEQLKLNDPKIKVNLTTIIEDAKQEKETLDLADLEEARKQKFAGEIIVDNTKSLICEINYDLLKRMMVPIRVMNIIRRVNASKGDQH